MASIVYHGIDIPRLLVLGQEAILVILYGIAAGRAYSRRVLTTERVLRNMFLGVIGLCVGVALQAVGVSLALLFFWETSGSLRLLLWQGSIMGFWLGGHFLVRYDYRTLNEYLVSSALAAKQATEQVLREAQD